MPAVSVIVPVYNVEPYIARCVRSLFGQTLQDMEFIFVDDCTPDKSMEIMWQILKDEFPERLSQVKFYRMPQNSGVAKVRMKGIFMASGDYVIHCDSDDMVDPDAYRTIRNDILLPFPGGRKNPKLNMPKTIVKGLSKCGNKPSSNYLSRG